LSRSFGRALRTALSWVSCKYRSWCASRSERPATAAGRRGRQGRLRQCRLSTMMRFADMVLAQSTEDAEIVGREEELGALARFIDDIDGNPFGCCSYPTGPTSIAVADNTVKRAGTAVPQDGILLNRTSHSTVVEIALREAIATVST